MEPRTTADQTGRARPRSPPGPVRRPPHGRRRTGPRCPQPVPDFDASLVPRNAPLSSLAQALVATSLALAKHFGKSVPDVKDPAELTGAEGLALVHEAA
jgi:hypothetical protein